MKVKYCSMAVLCSLALMMTGCRQQEMRESHPVKVKVMNVIPSTFSGEQEFSGTVEESSGSTLSFPVAGTVQQIRVDAGQRVAKGELIAVLDESDIANTGINGLLTVFNIGGVNSLVNFYLCFHNGHLSN